MKLVSFTVPCYNSESYMEKCVESLLLAGEDTEIIIVNDGSKDCTGEIAAAYEKRYPDRITAVQKENGGHGSGCNAGLARAQGKYFKVVDSDDWLDASALTQFMTLLREQEKRGIEPDLYICDYVYEHETLGTGKTVHLKNLLPQRKVFTWEDCKRFKIDQYFHMHSLIYRTALLRDEVKLTLPEHCFYVDNIVAYFPLPYVKSIYYLPVGLYRYYIGREGQSVNVDVMIRRIDQHIRINEMLITYRHLFTEVKPRVLADYMMHFLTMITTITSTFLILEGGKDAIRKKRELWAVFERFDAEMYAQFRKSWFGRVMAMDGRISRWYPILMYKLGRLIYKFN